MTSEATARLRLVDAPDEAGRTTASLVSSLATRLIALHYTSGVSVIGSLVAGLAAAGREVSRTAEGARLRASLLASPAGANGEALWAALRIGDWASGLPPSPVLDHVRNDLALLLAGDLEDALAATPLPPEFRSKPLATEPEPVTSIDCLMGLWVHSREIARAIEAIAALSPERSGPLEGAVGSSDDRADKLLR